MTFLQARLASWRYQRGSRSLEETLASSTISPQQQMTHEEMEVRGLLI